MPPRGGARVAAVAERHSSALAPLPHALALYIFSLLPVDQRLLCREVCRGWRAVLTEETSLWRRLDLSAGGVSPGRVATGALLHAAAARAAGHLETLDVSDCRHVSHGALLAAVTANSGTLRELRGSGSGFGDWPIEAAEALLRAAPGLRGCHAAVDASDVQVARAMLRADPPFAALRLESLSVKHETVGGVDVAGEDGDGDYIIDADAVLELAADVAACPFLRELEVCRAALYVPAALDALVDAALACPLHTLQLDD
jgi:hypothetical protein